MLFQKFKKRVFHQSHPQHRNKPRFLSHSVLKIASPEFPKSMINWKHQEVSRQNSLSGAASYPWAGKFLLWALQGEWHIRQRPLTLPNFPHLLILLHQLMHFHLQEGRSLGQRQQQPTRHFPEMLRNHLPSSHPVTEDKYTHKVL